MLRCNEGSNGVPTSEKGRETFHRQNEEKITDKNYLRFTDMKSKILTDHQQSNNILTDMWTPSHLDPLNYVVREQSWSASQ